MIVFNQLKSKYHFLDFIYFIILLLAIYITYRRLYFGVDFTDEAFYISLPLRFLQNDVPFVHDNNLTQFFMFFSYPFLKIFTAIHGNLDGSILFMRHVYFFSTICLGFTIYRVFKNFSNSKWINVSLTLICICFPNIIPTISYDTTTWLSFSFGILLLFHAHNLCYPMFQTISGIIFITIASICYPPIVPINFILVIAHFFYAYHHRTPLTTWGIACIVALLIAFYPIYLVITGDFLQSFAYHSNLAHQYIKALAHNFGATENDAFLMIKFKLIIYQFSSYFPKFYLLFISFIIAIFTKYYEKTSKKCIRYLVFPLLPFLTLSNFTLPSYYNTPYFITWYILIGILFFIPLREKQIVRNLFFWLLLPSICLGLLWSLNSGSGLFQFHVASFPGLLAVISVIMLYVQSFQNVISMNKIRFSQTICMALLVVVFTLYNATLICRDGPIKYLNEKITFSPYKGLYTSAYKKNYLQELNNDLKALTINKGNILCFYRFPAGYLFTNMYVAAPLTWLIPEIQISDYKNYYQKIKRIPDLIVFIKHIPYELGNGESYSDKNLLRDLSNLFPNINYLTIVNKNNYIILKK